jgi:hypothetical protein
MKSILTAALCLLSVCLFAQDLWRSKFGFVSELSAIKDLGPTFVSDPIFTGYTFDQNIKRWSNWGFNLGLRFEPESEKHPKLLRCWSPEIEFLLSTAQFSLVAKKIKNDLAYNDVKGLKYQVRYDYDYVVVNPLSGSLGFDSRGSNQPDNGDWQIFAEVSLPFYVNINKSNLEYFSNVKNNAEEDPQIKAELKKYLKGKDFFAVKYGLGGSYSFSENLAIMGRASYSIGLKDALETLANGHGFIDNPNNRNAWNFSLGVTVKCF